MAERRKSIAIDGPSGAGKSTIAREAASRFGFIYVDTGAVYRTVGLQAYRMGADPTDAQAIAGLLPDIDIRLKYDENGSQRMLLNDEDVTSDIRMHEISKYASDVSAHPCVREFLLDMQRELARNNDVIMDGRDIGTVVLPDAGLKIFLTASDGERARRRYEELREKGQEKSFDLVLADIRSRDHNDSTRALAPLAAAEDAVTLDTTGNSLEQSVELVISLIRERFRL